jgi:hypothetical protein
VADIKIYVIGGVVLLVGAGIIVSLIVLSRSLAGRTVGRAGKGNWAWEQLGYRSVGATRYGRGSVSTHFVRSYKGLEIQNLMYIKAGFGKTQQASAWVCSLSDPVKFGLQVIEAGIADPSLGARVSRAVDPYKYGWEQKFPEKIVIGDSELDQRFAILGTNTDAARRFLTEPAVRAMLLELKHVDMTLAESEVRFDDPFLVNVWGLDGQPLVDIHNQVSDLLVQAVHAARNL